MFGSCTIFVSTSSDSSSGWILLPFISLYINYSLELCLLIFTLDVNGLHLIYEISISALTDIGPEMHLSTVGDRFFLIIGTCLEVVHQHSFSFRHQFSHSDNFRNSFILSQLLAVISVLTCYFLYFIHTVHFGLPYKSYSFSNSNIDKEERQNVVIWNEFQRRKWEKFITLLLFIFLFGGI